LAVTDWSLRRWRLWILALMAATPSVQSKNIDSLSALATKVYLFVANVNLFAMMLDFPDKST